MQSREWHDRNPLRMTATRGARIESNSVGTYKLSQGRYQTRYTKKFCWKETIPNRIESM